MFYCLNQQKDLQIKPKLFHFLIEHFYYENSISLIEQNNIHSKKISVLKNNNISSFLIKCFDCLKRDDDTELYQIYICEECFVCKICLFRFFY